MTLSTSTGKHMSSGQTFTQATGNGDCALCSPDGRRLGASSHILEIASTVLGGIISALGTNSRKRQRDDGNTEDHAKWDIPVRTPSALTQVESGEAPN